MHRQMADRVRGVSVINVSLGCPDGFMQGLEAEYLHRGMVICTQ